MTTFAQLKEYVRDQYGDAADAKAVRLHDRIARQALRRIARSHDWSYYQSYGRIAFEAPYSTGTVAIVQGANVVNLAGGVWPANLATGPWHMNLDGRVNVEFEVATRNSDTQATFLATHTWIYASIAGRPFQTFRYRYSLPANFRKFFFAESENYWEMEFLTPAEFTELRLRADSFSGDPRFYTIRAETLFEVWPWPVSARILDFNYTRWPTQPLLDGDVIDWDDDLVDLLFAAVDVEVARSWGLTAPNRLVEVEARFQQILRETKSVDGTRVEAGSRQYTLMNRGLPQTRWRRQTGADISS